MTREEIDKIASDYLNDCESESDMLEVFAVAKEALEKEPCDDCVSRQAVLDATVNKNSIWNSITNSKGENLEEIISQLPSVQPKQWKHPITYEGRRIKMQTINMTDGAKKGRAGRYVIYDIDYLLDNLSKEVYLLESSRKALPMRNIEDVRGAMKDGD